MKTKISFILLLMFFTNLANGQDTLIYKTGIHQNVKFIKENSRKIVFANPDDSLSTKTHSVKKKLLNELRCQNDFIKFSRMTQMEFYELGVQHSKEFHYASQLLINNQDYLKGYLQKTKEIKTGKAIAAIGGTVVLSVLFTVGLADAMDSMPLY